jgi:arabinose-5-phosphate isomerase
MRVQLQGGGSAGSFCRVSHLKRARQVFDVEIAGLRAVRQQLDDDFEGVVELLVEVLRKRGKVVVVGIGKSGSIGRKIAATFTSTGTTSVVLHSVDALHGDVGVVNDGDVILALSYSGESEELLNLLPAVKRFAVRVVALTGVATSTLAKHSDFVLNVRVPREACPFNLAPTASTTAMLVMGDALAMAVLSARGFKQADFARYHPSGAIGRALLLRVKDIMRTGERNPVVKETSTVREGLWVMGKAKAGSVSVVNARGRLVGIFTDGDLRRCMTEDEGVLKCPLKDVMTRGPVTLREDALAAEALRIFNERAIDDLVVVDRAGRPVGLVDSQDLPRLKVM